MGVVREADELVGVIQCQYDIPLTGFLQYRIPTSRK